MKKSEPACGDHGSETEVELELWAESGGIHVKRFEYTCPENGKLKKLIREEIRQQSCFCSAQDRRADCHTMRSCTPRSDNICN